MSTLTMDRVMQQRLDAIAKANVVRLAGVDVKREIAAGVLSVGDALLDPRATSVTLFDLLRAQWRWGPDRSRRTLGRLDLHPRKRVGDLTDRQRELIAGVCSR